MIDFTYELEQLEEGIRTPELVEKIIKKHDKRAKEMKAMYERYKVNEVPIFKRKLDDPLKVNNFLNNDFVSEIIDTKVGYFAGTPISYSSKTGDEAIQQFTKRNRLADLDAEVTKYCGCCGYGARLQYIDKQGEQRVANVRPWEAALIGADGIDETDYALYYYTVQIDDNKEELRAELYEPFRMTEYRGGGVSDLKEYKVHEHVFSFCPLWGYENNEEHIGDAEKVINLIDAYDRAFSDENSEIEAFRSAIMLFYGIRLAKGEEPPSMSTPGMMFLEDGQKAEYLTKKTTDQSIGLHLDRLHENIYRFSKTPDLADEAFGGQVSGVAAKYKLLGLENKTATFERKFKSSTVRMFEIFGSAAGIKNIKIDPYEIEMNFTRTFPLDLLNEAQVQVALKGVVSEETRLSLFSSITDVQAEMTKLEADQEAYMELLSKEDNAVGGGADAE